MSGTVIVHKQGDTIYTMNRDGYVQGWIVQADGTLRPIIGGASK